MADVDDSVFYTVNGKEHCDTAKALSEMLAGGVLFANGRDYFEGAEKGGNTVVLYVLCNDLFVWGCADGEDLPYAEIGPLYKAWKADPKWGVDKWCCHHRNEQPQGPVITRMKNDGSWDDAMEALPQNTTDAYLKARLALEAPRILETLKAKTDG